jgi:hypothetical protein
MAGLLGIKWVGKDYFKKEKTLSRVYYFSV